MFRGGKQLPWRPCLPWDQLCRSCCAFSSPAPAGKNSRKKPEAGRCGVATKDSFPPCLFGARVYHKSGHTAENLAPGGDQHYPLTPLPIRRQGGIELTQRWLAGRSFEIMRAVRRRTTAWRIYSMGWLFIGGYQQPPKPPYVRSPMHRKAQSKTDLIACEPPYFPLDGLRVL